MSCHITIKIIPKVISKLWEERRMLLHHDKIVFTLEIIWLTISPVKPIHSLIHVRPAPLSWMSLIVTLSCVGSEPEQSILSNLSSVQQLRFEPVVDAWMVQFSYPSTIVEGTENVSIILGHLFITADEETSAS